MPPRGYHAGPRQPRDPYRDQHLVRLAMVLLQQLAAMPHKPPVTIALVLANLLFYVKPQGFEFVPSLQQGCLHPVRIIKSWQWWRLLWSPLLHADEMHVFYNMSSLLWKGGQLEPRLGSLPFLRLVAELALVSNALYVALGLALAELWPPVGRSILGSCAVGFSGVLFGLKVILNHDSPGWSDVYGVRLPTKYVCWVELVIAQLLVPNASLWGHLCGILAGLLHVWFLGRRGPFAPMARSGSGRSGRGSSGADAAGRLWRALFGGGRAAPRTYGHGTWGSGGGSGSGGHAGYGGYGGYAEQQAVRGLRGRGSGGAAGGVEHSSSWGESSSGERGGAGQQREQQQQRESQRYAAGGAWPEEQQQQEWEEGMEEPTAPQRQRGRGNSRGNSSHAGSSSSSSSVGMVRTAVAVAVYAVLAAAWVTNPDMTDFLSFAQRELAGTSRLPGSMQQALLWAQAKTGLGVTRINLHLASLVGVHDRWFLGAFGGWAPVLPALSGLAGGASGLWGWAAWAAEQCFGECWRGGAELLAHPPPGVWALQAAMAAVFLAWHLLPPPLVLAWLEMPPPGSAASAGRREGRVGQYQRPVLPSVLHSVVQFVHRCLRYLLRCLLASLSHDRLLPLARSLVFVALAGAPVESALGPVAMAGVFLGGSVAVHAGVDMARRLMPGWQRRRAVQGSKGAEPGLYALMLLGLAQQAQRALVAAQLRQDVGSGGSSSSGVGGLLLGFVTSFGPGLSWHSLASPVVRSMLSMAAGQPESPCSAVAVAALWLAVEHLAGKLVWSAHRGGRSGAGAGGSPGGASIYSWAAAFGGTGGTGGARRRRHSSLLWRAAALVLRAAAAVLRAVLGVAAAPLLLQLSALRWVRRWVVSVGYLLLLASLAMGDLSVATLQRASPAGELFGAGQEVACVGVTAALLLASLGCYLWRLH